MELTPFPSLISAMQPSNEQHTITLPADWLQGRTAYGGLSAAICLEATHRSHAALPALRSAQFCFIGPATGQLQISSDILRKGKSTVLTGSDVVGDSGLAVRSTFCFGAERVSTHDHQTLVMPKVASPNESPDFYTWSSRPNFMAHFDGRLADGARPCTPGALPEMTVWLRHHGEGDNTSVVRLLALADALPPAAMVMSAEPPMISTMSWSVDFLNAAPETPDGWWLVKAVADTSQRGYSSQSIVIWNSAGTPILVARQYVAIFG
jgi:acyl-CoA thioesterase